MDVYSLADGEALVKAARYAIELNVKSQNFDSSVVEKILSRYTERRGVFVTLEHYPTMSLRGCVGFPKATAPIGKLLVEAAIAASAEDSRFVPISHHELQEIVIEVSILSEPERIEKETSGAKKREVKVGRDGLIIHYGFHSGLLLPVVPIEEKWSKEEFLEGICEKAGLAAGTWRRPDVGLYKFTAQVFKEISPEGEVQEVKLK